MSRSTAKFLSVICMIAVILIMFLVAFSGNESVVYIVFVCYLPIAIYLNYCQRCRHCGRWPRKGDFWAEYCPGCGKKLDDKEG